MIAVARDWRSIAGTQRVVILEGWCVGALPQTPAQLAEPVNVLERDEDADGTWRRYVNDALAGRYRALFDRLARGAAAGASFEVVAAWRSEQERKLREHIAASGGDATR